MVVSALEQFVLGHTLLSTLIPRDGCNVHGDPLNLCHREWKNPWDTGAVSHASFLELMEGAEKEYLEILGELDSVFAAGTKERIMEKSRDKLRLKMDKIENSGKQIGTNGLQPLLTRLGNLSYHSGLDAGIPS